MPYFCCMNKWVGILLLTLVAAQAIGQIRLDRLEIKARQSYIIEESDVLVVDTLIMRDSSRLVLNKNKKENIINVKLLIANHGTRIVGHGANGEAGQAGANGQRQNAPCQVGGIAGEGATGGNGADGLNLSLYVNQLVITGSLFIDLNGGNGAPGGKGGRGGDGGGGTRVCRGGNGGAGGKGGNGGNGGKGGNLNMRCTQCQDLHLLQGHQFIINNYGGFAGVGANGGNGGLAGLGPSQEGRNGKKGLPGANGVAGKQGTVSFEKK